MVSRRAESEARAVIRVKDGEAGLREGTGKIICFKVPSKRQMTSYCEFREGVYSTLNTLHDETSTASDCGSCRL